MEECLLLKKYTSYLGQKKVVEVTEGSNPRREERSLYGKDRTFM